MKRETIARNVLDFTFLGFAVLGFAINLYLLSHQLTGRVSGIAGCGGGGCEGVIGSRWSVVFGIPVAAGGVAAWFMLIASSTEHFRKVHIPLLGVIAGAAGWFVVVQAVILKDYCPWCMAAHGAGLGALLLGVLRMAEVCGAASAVKQTAAWMVAAFLGLGLSQVFGPAPAGYRIEDGASAVRMRTDSPEAAGRKVYFDGGRKVYQVAALPRQGGVNGRHVLVELFDYQCAACRTMAGYMDALVARHPRDITVLLLPVPLEGSCNPLVSAENEHRGSCDMARTALAVWRAKPEAFMSFHRALMADPSVGSARRNALGMMTSDELRKSMADPWIDDLIRSNVRDWRALSGSTHKLPKLLVRDRRILHGLPSGEEDFIRVMEAELGL